MKIWDNLTVADGLSGVNIQSICRCQMGLVRKTYHGLNSDRLVFLGKYQKIYRQKYLYVITIWDTQFKSVVPEADIKGRDK